MRKRFPIFYMRPVNDFRRRIVKLWILFLCVACHSTRNLVRHIIRSSYMNLGFSVAKDIIKAIAYHFDNMGDNLLNDFPGIKR